MPQKYKRKEGAVARDPVPPDVLKLAVDRAVNGEALHTVAKEYGISRNTLRRYVRKIHNGGTTTFTSEYNKSQVFSDQEEIELSNYLEIMARMNHGLTTNLIDKLAYDLAVKNNKKYPKIWDKEKKAGYFWRKGFLNRHSELSLKKPEATSLSRATSFNKHNVDQFFNHLGDVLKREKFGPESIWNADETGVTTVQKCSKVIAPKKLRQVGHVTSAERGHLVTICNAVNALGNSIPPFFVFPRVKQNPAFLFGAPAGSEQSAHISGWMTEETFLYFLKHFSKHTRCSAQNKVLLIIDNHESHLSLAAVDFARANGLVILTFPPHCSHRMQPLDVSVYSSFKNLYYQKCTHRITIEKPGVPLSIYNVAELVGKAFPQSFTPANITSGFRKTGIWPYDNNVFTEVDFLCSFVTDRPQENENYSVGPEASNEADDPTGLEESNDVGKPIDPPVFIKGCGPVIQGCATVLYKQLGLGQPEKSSASFDRPSTSQGFVVSPEVIVPYPKAAERKTNKPNKGRKKGKTMIVTDTPNKKDIESEHLLKVEKRRKKEERAKKRLFQHPKTQKQIHENRPKKKKVDLMKNGSSETSNSDIDFSCESEDEQILELPLEKKVEPKVDDWVVVQFSGKKVVRKFIGKVVTSSDGFALTVKFARNCGEKRFKWPDTDDIAEVDLEQVVAHLHPPQFSLKNDRATSFTFKHTFPYVIE